MNNTKKIIISLASLIALLLIFPVLFMKLASPSDAMGIAFILFFAVNPVVSVGFGITAGTDMRRLFWLSFLPAVVFPPFFSIAISDFVADLYFYSAFYLPIGVLSMLITHFIRRKK